MCNLTMKEIITYYINRGSKLFSCFLDESKAFDRICYDKLFSILIDSTMPSVIVKSLLDMYTRQKVCTTWQVSHSEYFGVCNSIRQGGNLSTLLYTVYADELMKMLAMSGLRCYIRHIYVGALCYTDDITLLSPTSKGLQKMFDVCKEFRIEFDVNYNEKKTVAIYVSRFKEMIQFDVYLDNKKLQYVDKVKHLGITVHFNLVDDDEIRRRKGDFDGITNSLHAQYRKRSSDFQSRLFDTYCTHFYRTEMWNVRQIKFANLCTCWNIAVRILCDLLRDSH